MGPHSKNFGQLLIESIAGDEEPRSSGDYAGLKAGDVKNNLTAYLVSQKGEFISQVKILQVGFCMGQCKAY